MICQILGRSLPKMLLFKNHSTINVIISRLLPNWRYNPRDTIMFLAKSVFPESIGVMIFWYHCICPCGLHQQPLFFHSLRSDRNQRGFFVLVYYCHDMFVVVVYVGSWAEMLVVDYIVNSNHNIGYKASVLLNIVCFRISFYCFLLACLWFC